jgi:hypothetical protein
MSRVSSGHVLSETAGARAPFCGEPLNSFPPSGGAKGACIDGEDRFFVKPLSGGLVISVRTFCPVVGLIARLRGQAQVAAATPLSRARYGMCSGREYPANRRKHRG